MAPLAWALSTSLKTPAESVASPHWIPKDFTLDSWRKVFEAGNIPNWFVNSLVVSIFVADRPAGPSLAGYGFARTEFRGKSVLMAVTMAGLMFSPAILGVRSSPPCSRSAWSTPLGMILPQCAPAAMVYILYKFFQSLPRELEEAAFIDGAGQLADLLHPRPPAPRSPRCRPSGSSPFIASWNNFLWPAW